MNKKSDSKTVPEKSIGKVDVTHFVLVQVDGLNTERSIRYSRIETDVRHLAGKILTQIDASITEPVQREAVKDLVKSHIRYFIGMYQDMCFPGQGGSKTLPEL